MYSNTEMEKRQKKILFLGNEANLDGAPLRLVELLDYYNDNNKDILLDLQLLSKGSHPEMYIGKVRKLKIKGIGIVQFLDRLAKRFLRYNIYDFFVKREKYTLFYANSIVCLPDAVHYKSLTPGSRVILHLRELETICRRVKDIEELLKQVDEFNVISVTVGDMLINRFGIDRSRINLTYSGTYLKQVDYTSKAILSQLTIGTCGGVFWRKGIEQFIQVANIIVKKYPNVKFEWLGPIGGNEKIIYGADLKKLELVDHFKFLGSSGDVLNVMKDWFLFLSTAKEEALGVSIIEAGSLGIPIICFEKSGGPGEILAHGGGVVVPYLDVSAMVAAIEMYIHDQEKYFQDSQIILREVQKYDISLSLPKIEVVINRNV